MALEKQTIRLLQRFTGCALLAFLLLFGQTSVMLAQSSDAEGSAASASDSNAQENVMCQVEMKKFLDIEFSNYVSFIETTVQNKSGTLSLLDTLIGRYREFRSAVMSKYLTFTPYPGASQLTEGIEPEACSRMVQEKLEVAKKILEIRVRSSSAVKKSTALLEKYQHINSRLRTLHQSFISLKAFLDTFSQKLPCYVKKSCNKG